MKDNIKLTKEDKLEAYKILFGDDEEYINSFFKGYKPKGYFDTTCTSTNSKGFTLDDMYKAMEQLKKLPPTPIEIEIGQYALNVLLEQIPKIDNTKYIGNPNTMYGLPITLYDGYEFEFNQMRIKYSNGDSKILDVFKWEINRDDLYKNIFKLEDMKND